MENKSGNIQRARLAARIMEILASREPLSTELRALIDRWLIESINDEIIDNALRNHFEKVMSESVEEDYAASDWDKIAKRCFGNETNRIETDQVTKTTQYLQKQTELIPLRRFSILFRVAAVLIPLFIIASAMWLTLDKENKKGITGEKIIDMVSVSAVTDKNNVIVLPDSSHVVLKEGSTLNYARDFSENRMVVLDGEAFFSVTKDEANPFTVQNGNMKVTVLGTEFNVKAYTGEIAEVVLTSGKVEITDGNESTTLNPGQRATVDQRTQTITLDEIGESELNRLRGINLSLEGNRLDEAFGMISSYFGVKVKVVDKIEMSDKISIPFHDDITLESALQLLQMTTEKFNYTIKQDTVTITKR